MGIKLLLLGAILFVGIHLVPTLGSTRDRLVTTLSLNGYKFLYTIVSLTGLGLMIWGKTRAPITDIWAPVSWARDVAPIIMLPSMILLAVAKFPTNIKRLTPHPMLWGFILWSTTHLLANGDLASIILFGTIGAYSIVAILSANSRGAKVSTTPVSPGKEAVAIGLGFFVYVVFLYLHPILFGVAVI